MTEHVGKNQIVSGRMYVAPGITYKGLTVSNPFDFKGQLLINVVSLEDISASFPKGGVIATIIDDQFMVIHEETLDPIDQAMVAQFRREHSFL